MGSRWLIALVAWVLVVACGPIETAFTSNEVTLPIEAIQPVTVQVDVDLPVSLTVTVGLPSSCYQLERLSADIETDEQRVDLTAWGRRATEDFCAEVYTNVDLDYTLEPLTTTGEWVLRGEQFGEPVEVTLQVMPT